MLEPNKAYTSDNVSVDDMKRMAEHIESFLELRDSIIIDCNHLSKSDRAEIDAAEKIVAKLIKKLKSGNTTVFIDEWDSAL